MWPTLRKLWLALSGNAPSRPAPRRRPAFRRPAYRPRLEALEDRAVPASLSYSTFLHGTVYGTTVDRAGNIYVTGQTDSSLPTTPGAFQTTGSGAFVAKLNATGTALIYATYLGNGGLGTGIAVDAAGDAYVIGEWGNLPTTANAIASSGNGGTDFVAELNPTGSSLSYATYIPGTRQSGDLGLPAAIAVDSSGNIYVAGDAGTDFPVTANAFQAYRGSGGSNAFFAKINPTLSGSASLLYASCLGGEGDQASRIAVDSAGNAYVTGMTGSGNFPTTSGAFQRSYGGGLEDVFVAKFNPSLSGSASLVYSTYLGGGGLDGYQYPGPGAWNPQINGGIAVDSAGNAYITSTTSSHDFPTTRGAFQIRSSFGQNGGFNHPSDAFVTKLNATGTALVYSTYIGAGSHAESAGTSIAVDANGDAHVTGWTNSTTFPTHNALQTTNAGGLDAFVTVLNPTGSGLLFSSYFGGSGNDYGFGIALDSAGNAYVGGQTSSSNFPTTAGAYQTTPGSGFALQIDPPADVSEVSVPIDGSSVPTAVAASSGLGDSVLARSLSQVSLIDSVTASPYPAMPGSNTTPPATNLTSTTPDGGTKQVLGYGTQPSPGVWKLTFTVSLVPGSYRLYAQATDSDGVFGDLAALTLAVV
jgi:hypothetical protein